MSLLQLATGKEATCSICIRDSVAHSGRNLTKILMQELARRVDEVHVFAFDMPVHSTLTGIDSEVRQKIRCHDGWTDPLGWIADNSHGKDCNVMGFTPNKELIDHVREKKGAESERVGVIIDSLTPLILNTSAALTCRTLQAFVKPQQADGFQVSQVISLLHSDTHEEGVLRTIEHQCSTVIAVSAGASTRTPEHAPLEGSPLGCVDILHKKSSGKILRKKEGYGITSDNRLHSFTLTSAADISESNVQPDPTANLTFNLTLTESEKRARENVILPYTRHSAQSGTGQIFYEPDKDDDYDDEDPDDDLDI